MIFIRSQNVVHQVNAAKVLQNNSGIENSDQTRGNVAARGSDLDNGYGCNDTTSYAQILPLSLQVVDKRGGRDKGWPERMGQSMNGIGWPLVKEGKF